MQRLVASCFLIPCIALAGCGDDTAPADVQTDMRPASDVAEDSSRDTGSDMDEEDVSGDTEPADTATADAPDAATEPPTLCSGELEMTAGLRYAETHDSNLLDLYVPADGGPCPLIVWVHGGGWQAGSRNLGRALLERLTRQSDRGYAFASIDYRLSGDAIFPAQINDVKAALRWLRANAETLGIDPTRIAVMGSSAGGHLVSLTGTSGGVADLEDLDQGNEEESSTVQAVIDCYGPTTFSEMDSQLADNGCPRNAQRHSQPDSPESRVLGCEGGLATCPEDVMRADPITYIDATDPPFLIGHGTEDCTVPPGQSRDLHAALMAAGVPTDLHIIEMSGHVQTSCPPDEAIDVFLDEAFGVTR